MADSWEDEEFDVPSAVPPTSAPVSWEDEVSDISSAIMFIPAR